MNTLSASNYIITSLSTPQIELHGVSSILKTCSRKRKGKTTLRAQILFHLAAGSLNKTSIVKLLNPGISKVDCSYVTRSYYCSTLQSLRCFRLVTIIKGKYTLTDLGRQSVAMATQ